MLLIAMLHITRISRNRLAQESLDLITAGDERMTVLSREFRDQSPHAIRSGLKRLP